jgi:hypothetical protein
MEPPVVGRRLSPEEFVGHWEGYFAWRPNGKRTSQLLVTLNADGSFELRTSEAARRSSVFSRAFAGEATGTWELVDGTDGWSLVLRREGLRSRALDLLERVAGEAGDHATDQLDIVMALQNRFAPYQFRLRSVGEDRLDVRMVGAVGNRLMERYAGNVVDGYFLRSGD